MGDEVNQLRGQVEVLRLALSDSGRRYKEMHGLMTRAFELRQLTAARLAYLVEACSMSVPMDNYHPDVLVFNEDPTRLLREALVLAVNDLEGASPVPEEQSFHPDAAPGMTDLMVTPESIDEFLAAFPPTPEQEGTNGVPQENNHE